MYTVKTQIQFQRTDGQTQNITEMFENYTPFLKNTIVIDFN